MKRIAVVALVAMSVSGCSLFGYAGPKNNVLSAAVVGGVAGAIVGSVATGTTTGTLVGAGIGAAAGAAIATALDLPP